MRSSEAGLAGNPVGIYDVDLELLADDVGLDVPWQVVPDLVEGPRRIEQKGRAGPGLVQQVVVFQEGALVTGDEFRLVVADGIG